MNDNILSDLYLYRKSVALHAFLSMGINKVLSTPKDLATVAGELGVDQELISVFLLYLKTLGYVIKDLDKYMIPSSLSDHRINQQIDIILHEQNIMERWNTTDRLKQILFNQKPESKDLNFELSGSEKLQYVRAMNGNNLRMIAILCMKECKKKLHLSFLEYGRSVGAAGLYLNTLYPDIACTVALPPDCFELYTSEYERKYRDKEINVTVVREDELETIPPFDCSLIYNTVHYYSQIQLTAIFTSIVKRMSANSLLCIADIFINSMQQDMFFLLDWITHGGTNHIYMDDILKIAGQCGLELYKTIEINNTQLVILLLKLRTC